MVHLYDCAAQPKRVVAMQHSDKFVSQTNVVANVSIASDAKSAFFDFFVQVEQNGLEERALKNAAQFAPRGKVLPECTVNGQSGPGSADVLSCGGTGVVKNETQVTRKRALLLVFPRLVVKYASRHLLACT